MSPVYIKTWIGKSGKRYRVYWRPGGRAHKERYAGSFKTIKEARARRDFVAGELANGRDPRVALDKLKQPAALKPTLAASWDRWAGSRKDVGESAQKLYANSREWWLSILGAKTDPATVTVDGVLAGIDEMLDDLAPSTVGVYLSHLAMTLDFADVIPNPARSKKIKLPTTRREVAPPTNDEWTKLVRAIAKRSLPALRLMECDGLRISEACGVEPGDVDLAAGQILIRRSVTKTNAGRRWIPTPPELLEQLPVGVTPSQVYYDIRTACTKAGIRHFGTHAFRHRRISLWLRQGVDSVTVSRWAGHAKASESTDTYGHTVVDAFEDEWLSFWMGAYRAAGAAPVRHQQVTE